MSVTLDTVLILAILVIDTLMFLDARAVKNATILYWKERRDYFARRARAKGELPPAPEGPHIPEPPPPATERTSG